MNGSRDLKRTSNGTLRSTKYLLSGRKSQLLEYSDNTKSYTTFILPFLALLTVAEAAETCSTSFVDDVPKLQSDYDQPDWAEIIKIAFPPWDVPANGCPRLDKIGGSLEKGYEIFPTPVSGKFNPCYYTKAFAGLDPLKGGYPTPIDTKYHYEFAAPFFKQPGDGSTHHCPMNAKPNTPVQSCPKAGTGGCGNSVKDCNVITAEFGIGHVPPFVPLAAIKNALLGCEENVCDWFKDGVDECSIPKMVTDRLIKKTFGTADGKIKFTPPKILDNLNATDPKSTYYKLEYLDDPEACKDKNCRGPHYCSKAAADADIWGDFCPYIHTGENSGLYRHPHIALAAIELWIANKCNPTKCPPKWLESPAGKNYGKDPKTSTSITWSQMDNNTDPMAQPSVPYSWPNSGDGIYPGHELYGDNMIKPAPGSYVTKYVAAGSKMMMSNSNTNGTNTTGGKESSASRNSSILLISVLALVASILF